MSMSNTRWVILTVVLSVVIVLAMAHKSGPRIANHAFNFDSPGVPENPGIDVLDYQYGTSGMVGTHADAEDRARGHIAGMNVHGEMPVGDFLYVKWRVESTGKIYEDRVDLKSRLPRDMEDKVVHFMIKDSHLYVYVISENEGSARGAPDCPAHMYFHNKCTRIYPDHWSNF